MKRQDITKWQARITRAESYLNERREERLQSLRLYTGTFFNKAYDNSDEFSEVNFVYEFCDVLISSIYARNPFIFSRAYSSSYVAFAETMEKVINYYVNELNWKKKIQSCIIDGILQPPGWIGLGYLYINEKTKAKKEIEDEFPELKDLDKKEKSESQMGIFDETAKMDDVFLEHISSWNVLFPEGHHVIRECPYIAIRQKTTLEDLYNNPMYKDIKYQIRNSSISRSQENPSPWKLNSGKSSSVFGGVNDETDLETIPVELFHIWDRRSMKRFTLVRNFTEDAIFERDWDYLSEGFPVFDLIFNEIPATDEKCNAYPLSDVVPMFPQLKELSKISSAMMRHRKRAGTVIMAQKGQITDAEISKMQAAGDMDIVTMTNIKEDVVRVFNPAPLPNDFYNMRNVVLEDLLRISGYSQLLGNARGVDTATESENIRAGSVLRQARRVDIIEEFTKSIAIYFAGLLWQFKTRKQVSEIIGEEVTEQMWPTLPENMIEARRVLQKQLYFKIDAGSTQPPKDEAIERKEWETLAGVIKANFPNRIKDDIFLAQLLKKYDFRDIEKAIITNDEPEIAAAQEENKFLLNGVPQVVSPNENHMLHLQVHAQAYQTPGLNITQQMDEHILKHQQFMEMNSPKANPQRGDAALPTQTTTPDLQRGGMTEFADLLGSTKPRAFAQNTGGK